MDSNSFLQMGEKYPIFANCSDTTTFLEQSQILTKRSLDKGFPKEMVHSTLERTKKLTQSDCLFPSRKHHLTQNMNNSQKKFTSNFITTYNSNHNQVRT
ncbi:hypothetical protein GDO81_012078 [Engystomops pustulosus]|uniref:Uncharacterized protein n=1 Tax=Engystomops pustulosus TaxID=76066 RepID=A0AAV7BIR8_ENGPU|nr:hypothetical protein GDO81_012078 [Engystomops pustulosus]